MPWPAIPLIISSHKERMLFDVITAWEVFEHIREEDLPVLVNNITRHLESDGICVFSISSGEEIVNGKSLHQTCKPKKWWADLFLRHGLHHSEIHLKYFRGQFVRGGKYDNEDFNFILGRGKFPEIPKESLFEKT